MEKWERRDRKLRRRRYGMRVSGRSLKSIIVPVIEKKAKEAHDKHKSRQGRQPEDA